MKTVAVFTGNRAEFGLQTPLLIELKNSKEFNLVLIVGASHVDPEFGLTIEEIEKTGFESNYKLDFKHKVDELSQNPKTIAEGISLISEGLKEISPDLFIVYADRYEGFAAIIASTQIGTLTAHIEGGDVTEGGTFDDSVRHAMTKLSHIHFTTNKLASTRIAQLGENPDYIFEVGLPAVDLIAQSQFTNKDEIIAKYELKEKEKVIVFTQHPIPVDKDSIKNEFAEIEKSLADLSDTKVICTYPNSDIGGKEIIQYLESWDNKYNHINLYKSLGRDDFHGLLNLNNSSSISVCYLGNSSAGIKETPALKCPAIIIGDRQKGRLHSTNVLFTVASNKSISQAIEKVFNDLEFIDSYKNCLNPYGSGDMGKKTIKILSNLDIEKDMFKKKFIDLNL